MMFCPCAILVTLVYSLGPGTFNVTVESIIEQPRVCRTYKIDFPSTAMMRIESENQFPFFDRIEVPLPQPTEFGRHRIYYCWGEQRAWIDGHLVRVNHTRFNSMKGELS